MSFPNSENSGVNVKRMGENSNRKCFRTEVNVRMLHFLVGEFFVVVLWVFLWVCWGFFELSSYESFKKYSKTDSGSVGQLRDHFQTSTQRPTFCGTNSVHRITHKFLTRLICSSLSSYAIIFAVFWKAANCFLGAHSSFKSGQ